MLPQSVDPTANKHLHRGGARAREQHRAARYDARWFEGGARHTHRLDLGLRFHGQNGRCWRLASSRALHTNTLPCSSAVKTLPFLLLGRLISKFIGSANEIEITGVCARWLTRLPKRS